MEPRMFTVALRVKNNWHFWSGIGYDEAGELVPKLRHLFDYGYDLWVFEQLSQLAFKDIVGEAPPKLTQLKQEE